MYCVAAVNSVSSWQTPDVRCLGCSNQRHWPPRTTAGWIPSPRHLTSTFLAPLMTFDIRPRLASSLPMIATVFSVPAKFVRLWNRSRKRRSKALMWTSAAGSLVVFVTERQMARKTFDRDQRVSCLVEPLRRRWLNLTTLLVVPAARPARCPACCRHAPVQRRPCHWILADEQGKMATGWNRM